MTYICIFFKGFTKLSFKKKYSSPEFPTPNLITQRIMVMLQVLKILEHFDKNYAPLLKIHSLFFYNCLYIYFQGLLGNYFTSLIILLKNCHPLTHPPKRNWLNPIRSSVPSMYLEHQELNLVPLLVPILKINCTQLFVLINVRNIYLAKIFSLHQLR